MLARRKHKLWAIILAGGEGTRLAPLTRALYGTALPKQFAVLKGSRSMLQTTVDRILPIVPARRIVVVVSRKHEELAREQLREWGRDVTLLIQPRNLDTAPGLLLPLARIRERDRSARVVVLPADHHVARPTALRRIIAQAEAATTLDENAISLLGAEPDSADTEYGWMVPGTELGRFGMRVVERFVEKPVQSMAEELLRGGAMWNTFIMVASAEALWCLSRSQLPEHAERLARSRRPGDLEQAYAALPAANFSREVLERAADLALIPLCGAGWSDWGTPRRVFESLLGTAEHGMLLGRIPEPARALAVC